MSITLDTVVLPDDLLWADEIEWTPVVQSTTYTLTGSLLVEPASKAAGRPITLSGDESTAWTTRAVVLALMAMAAVAGKSMTLDYHGRTFTVMFRHQDHPAIESAPVVDYVPPAATDFFTLKLKLMVI